MGGAEWADSVRMLGPDESSTPGPWRTMGWQRYVLDLFADPSVDWIVVLKAAQMGVSELVRCAIGRWAMVDPGDVLWVMSDEKSARKAMAKLRLMFTNTPALRALLPEQRGQKIGHGRRTKDTLLELVLTNGMRVVIGWAGSPASLASDPFMRVILDETGLYPSKVGTEGSPIGLAEERTKTFGRRRKVILLSKPAHADDLICSSHAEVLHQAERHVPCPECGDLAPLEWERVRWLDSEGSVVAPAGAPESQALRIALAAHVEASQSAWVECASEGCRGKITDTLAADSDERAEWLRVGEDTESETRRRALHISELYHWSKTVSDLVARFLRAIKPGDLQNFHTGSLGRPYEQERGAITAELFERKATHAPGRIPEWATGLVASADTQKDHFWFMVRAWGPGYRSRLVDFGRVETFDELRTATLETRWPIDGTDRTAGALRLVIDSGGGTAGGALDGSRSQEVYAFAEATPHVYALKGTGEKKGAQQGVPMTWGQARFGEDKSRTVAIVQPHANYWKDQTAKLCRGDGWEETTAASSKVYTRQMTGQRQVWEETTKGQGRWVWRKRRGRADHLWDCAYMNVVGAELEDTNMRERLADVARAQARARAAERDYDDDPDDWVGKTMRGGGW